MLNSYQLSALEFMEEFLNSHRQRLIVNADDFGVSDRANRNTLLLISLGKINRVGIMTNGKISAKEIDELARSGVKLDIHLDILHELDDQRKERSSAAARVIEFGLKVLSGKISSKKVEADWINQIEAFKTMFGRNPDGINSHEHVHFFPPFFKVAIRLAQQYDIPYLRFGESVVQRHPTSVERILHILRKINLKTFNNSGRVSSGSLLSIDWIKNLDKFLENLPEGTIEIACHPELADDFVKVKKYF